MRALPTFFLAAGASLLVSCAAAQEQVATGAGASLALPSWSDGLAEVAGYRSVASKYGEPRRAEEFLITVEEDQDREALVKALPGAPDSQRRRVVKLNRELTIPTGIYTYRQMSSAFVDSETLRVTKIAASSQEWCGTTFVEALVEADRLRLRTFSYFEGEGDRTFEIPWPEGAWAADALPVLARALPRDRGGALADVPFLRSVLGNRVAEPALRRASVRWTAPRAAGGARGQRSVQEVVVTVDDGSVHELTLEATGPRRVLSWLRPDGSRAELQASERLAYWRMSAPGMEGRREALLSPR